MLFAGTNLPAQFTGDALGMHSLGPGTTSPIKGFRSDPCSYCHAPHSGQNIGLWNQKLTTQNYAVYTSTTETNTSRQPHLGSDSNHCLSCHDGTVAGGVGNTTAYGQVTMTGSMASQDVFGSNLASSHPFSMQRPLKDSINMVASIVSSGKTADTTGAIQLIRGDVECTSCHNPHVQAKDSLSLNFLAMDSSKGQMCLACHDPLRTLGSQVNPLADWATSAHALSTAAISPSANLGSYPTVNKSACISCHTSHNAAGPARALRGQNESDCIACHNGSNISPMPGYANVFPEYAKATGHPMPTSSPNPHDETESVAANGNPATVLLNNNRHATCVDCHNAHGSQSVGPVGAVFPPPPLIRISQKDIAGISASDGITVLTPAVNQYENCLRCHGNSTGKQIVTTYGYFPVRAVATSDPLNLISQFATSAASSHPVIRTATAVNQISLRTYMLNFDGSEGKRTMGAGSQLMCTDCHNSDDNREFGGTGPNGPHGSKWTHILEHRYEFSQAPGPGQTITTTYPAPDVTVNGPYGLCAKCHDLGTVLTSASWSGHFNHVSTDGLSCSTCHTAHGNASVTGSISGQRLVNFDLNVVGPVVTAGNVKLPISYTYGPNTCVLVCHGATHNTDGTVTMAKLGKGSPIKK
jgi:predicted CXXCH cytochrome family protein